MRFRTKILESDGSTVQTELEAQDEQSLHDLLHREGRTLLRIKPLDAGKQQVAIDVKVTPRRLLLLTQCLQEALDAGVPLLSTFQALGDQEADPQMVALLEDLANRVATGQQLSDALAAHPRSFPVVYCALVRAGEQSGSLPDVLESVTGFLEWRLEISGIVKQAMIYPLAIAIAGYCMVLFMLSFVIPRLGSVLSKMSGELPAASLLMIKASGFVEAHILAIALGSVAAAITLKLSLKTRPVQAVMGTLMVSMPIVRGVVGTLAIAQFTRTFGVLLHAGLTMTHALELGGASVASPRFRAKLDTARDRITSGARLGEALDEVDLLPPVALSMVKVGEEAGRLPITFKRLSRLYDREVKEAVKKALGMLEPIVTVVLGLVVGGVAVLVVGTIYSAMKGIGK